MTATLSATDWTQVAVAAATLMLAIAASLSLREGRRLALTARDQVELAIRSFAYQIAPLLMPADEHTFGVGERENVASKIQPMMVLPVHIGIVNMGNGVAVLDGIDADGGPLGRPDVLVPPTVGPGETKRVRLDFLDTQSVRSGDVMDVAVRYHGVDGSDACLTFSARFLYPGRWRIESVEHDLAAPDPLAPV